MRNTARQTRENRTITINFHDETTYFRLLDDGKAFVELVMAFILSLGFQLKHKATCRGGGLLQEWLVICYNKPDCLDPRSPETGHERSPSVEMAPL